MCFSLEPFQRSAVCLSCESRGPSKKQRQICISFPIPTESLLYPWKILNKKLHRSLFSRAREAGASGHIREAQHFPAGHRKCLLARSPFDQKTGCKTLFIHVGKNKRSHCVTRSLTDYTSLSSIPFRYAALQEHAN